MVDPDEIRRVVDDLAKDKGGQKIRVRVCRALTEALAITGRTLWVMGSILGPDRVAGESPFDFGNDEMVGVATVAQIGGELGGGAIGLLNGGNRYAAAALTRQLVEVEYLAAAFAAEDRIAADWLRADGKQRRNFWSPQNLRKRSNGQFLNSDYWNHCDMGGHPSIHGMLLLPDHHSVPIELSWADVAGHLFGIWKSTLASTERLIDGPIPSDWGLPDIPALVARWEKEDRLTAALRGLNQLRRDDPDAFSSFSPGSS